MISISDQTMKRPILSAIALCMITISHAQKSKSYHLNVGEVFSMTWVAHQEVEFEIYGMTNTVVNDIAADFTLEVVEESNEDYKLSFSYLSFKTKSFMPDTGVTLMEADTEAESSEGMMHKLLKGLTGGKMYVRMNKNGEITKVEGNEALIEKMVNNANIEDANTKVAMKQAMSKEFGSKKLMNSLSQMTFFYPEEPATANESWSNGYTGDFSAKNTWTLKNSSSRLMRVDGVSDIILDIDNDDLHMRLEGTQQSTIVIDSKTGFPISITSSANASGTSTFKNIEGQEGPSKLTQTITYTRI